MSPAFVPILLAALLSTLPAAPPTAQDKPPIPPVPPVPGGEAPPVTGSAFPDLVPGELPAGTAPEAAAVWRKVVAASLGVEPGKDSGGSADGGAGKGSEDGSSDGSTANGARAIERAPVTAFDLAIDLRYRASKTQSNDLPDARYRWLAPSFVRAETGRGGTHLRGPLGSFFIDSKDAEHVRVVRLDQPGRELAEDRRQLEEIVGLAGNFARLTDPRALRIARLATIESPPVTVLPQMLSERAQKLAWLELESPDFTAMRSTRSGPRLARVQLGIDRTSHQVTIAVVDDAASPRRVTESTAVLLLEKYAPVDGFAVPKTIQVFLPEVADPDAPAPVTLRPKPAMDILVKRASLRAQLGQKDFMPPDQP